MSVSFKIPNTQAVIQKVYPIWLSQVESKGEKSTFLALITQGSCLKINTTKSKFSKSFYHSRGGKRRSIHAGIMRAVEPWSEWTEQQLNAFSHQTRCKARNNKLSGRTWTLFLRSTMPSSDHPNNNLSEKLNSKHENLSNPFNFD